MDTSEKQIVYVKLLGSFSMGDRENGKWEQNTAAGKKALSFLQYLIVNHARNVSAQELIDRFWSQRSNDPINALRSMIFKIRKYLKEAFPEQEDMLVTFQGCYAWNPKIRMELDAEQFERACLKVRKLTREAGTEMLSQALSLYKGDFLASNDSDWAIPMRRYYQTLYLDACREALPFYQKKERYLEMVALCEQIQNIDFAAEDAVAYQMQALISLGQSGQAVERYERFKEQLWEEFQMEPSRQVEQIYALADSMNREVREKEDVLKLVMEEKPDGHAFFCSFQIFQKIIALERRHLDRTGMGSTLVVVSLGNKVIPSTDAKRLERILLNSLRANDPVARLDASSYIFMLIGSTPENACLVTERLERAFRKAYSHSKACISFRMSPLEAAEKISVENL